MKILLIIPKFAEKGFSYDLPMGFAYLSAVLRKAGHTVAIENLSHYPKGSGQKEIAENILKFNPQIIGTGGMSFSFNPIKAIIALAKQVCPTAKTVVGGMVVTSQPEIIYDALGADVGVIGEAEDTIVPLVETLGCNGDLATVEGIIFRDKKTGELITTPPRPLIKDLDRIPFPDYDGMGIEEYITLRGQTDDGGLSLSHHDNPRYLSIHTSRGCPLKCTFCCYELIESSYRMRSIDNVMAEIEFMVEKYQINNLFISDDLFPTKKSRLTEFCERIKPFNLNWICSIRVTPPLSPEILKLMRESGCKALGYGIESMSPAVLTSMKKKISVAQIEKTLKSTYDAKIGIGGNFIFFDPAETKQTLKETLTWFKDNPQYIIRMANVGFHPGTFIYESAVERGLITDRIKYLQDDKFEINATTISDEEYVSSSRYIQFLLFVLGYSGKITSVTDNGDNSISLSTICPHCHSNNSYKKIIKKPDSISWISCRDCNRRYRLPIINSNKRLTIFDESFEYPVSESIEKQAAIYYEIANKTPNHYGAFFEIGKILIALGKSDEAIPLLENCLSHFPFNANFHIAYAEAL
ncbi:MAG: cobalamin-dependent protein [Magnetococcales bacterium]|nr:cobalamin-dependent protein [Magnetococcales bacterium]